MFKVFSVVFHDEFAGVLVEGAFGEGDDEQAFDDLEDVVERPRSGVPILLQRVHANLAFFGDVGMENLRYEKSCMSSEIYLWED